MAHKYLKTDESLTTIYLVFPRWLLLINLHYKVSKLKCHLVWTQNFRIYPINKILLKYFCFSLYLYCSVFFLTTSEYLSLFFLTTSVSNICLTNISELEYLSQNHSNKSQSEYLCPDIKYLWHSVIYEQDLFWDLWGCRWFAVLVNLGT